jgi:peptidyl-prolyl cis-trans isomerase A (cyclophilin A)
MKRYAVGYLAKKIGVIVFSALLVASVSANAQNQPLVRISTSMGDLLVELQSNFAPNTVANFLRNVDEKVYDGTIFHKMVPDFVLQGGGFDQKFIERPTKVLLPHEGQLAAARGDFKNTAGTIGMARNSTRDSASLEFFINLASNPDLDPVPIPETDPVSRFEWGGKVYVNVPRERLVLAPELFGYTPFGKIISGGDLIEKFKKLATSSAGPFRADVPVVPLVIHRIERVTRASLPLAPIVPPAPLVAETKPAIETTTAASIQQVTEALRRWSTAWSSKDTGNYFAAYTPDFAAKGTKNHLDWQTQRLARITEKSKISVQLIDVEIKVTGETAVARFNQVYQADSFKSSTIKTLTFTRLMGSWLILQEDSK